MKLLDDEMVAILANSGRVTSESLSKGSVLRQYLVDCHCIANEIDDCQDCGDTGQIVKLRVVFEKTGDSYAFQNHEKDQAVDWRQVHGWASY